MRDPTVEAPGARETRAATGRAAVADFRVRRQTQLLHSYEPLTSADRWRPRKNAAVAEIMAGRWTWKGRPTIALTPAVDWNGVEDRSQRLALHSWEPLAALLASYDCTANRPSLERAVELAASWLERFPFVGGDSSFAWYDSAVGMRSYRLGYMLDVIARDPFFDDELVERFLSGLVVHAETLASEERFAHHSNHGLYQIMGQLAIARRFPDVPEAAAAASQADGRLEELLAAHFTSEGVHREHSPAYHQMVLVPLSALQRSGLVRTERLDALQERAEEALAWFITPASRYATFGDTTRRPVGVLNVDSVRNPQLAFALTCGRDGAPPHTVTRAFPESGYVVFRDRWPTGTEDFADCSYLAQTCAFHSRVHKHADDLSFVWYDRGSDILTDPGRFGYVGRTDPASELAAEGFWYSDPRRIYVESTRSHNAVEVDGRSTPRRGVAPYGSALTGWGETDEVRYSEARLSHHGGVNHIRMLLFLPGSWVIVIDRLVDGTGKSHDLMQRFHLAPELELDQAGANAATTVTAQLPAGDRVHALALLPQDLVAPVRGVAEPQMLGWISPRDGALEPQWTFGWSATGVSSFTFASLLCFAENAPRAELSANAVSPRLTTARLAWSADGKRHAVDLRREPDTSVGIAYSTA
jgi:hypothetical protein